MTYVGERYCSLPRLIAYEEEFLIEKILRTQFDPIMRSYESVECVVIGKKVNTEKYIVSFA